MTIQNTAIVIDDHPLVARGIASFLESHCSFDLVSAASTVDDLWKAIDLHNPPQMIVLDFWLPDGASLPLLSQLIIKLHSTRILVVSADDAMVVQKKVKLAGAHGFINKQETADIFVQAVASLLSGKTWFIDPHQQINYLNQPKELTITAEDLGLTSRQGQILAMIIQGLPNKRIAQVLTLSEQTVKEHVSGILNRLGVNNRIEAITKLRGKRLE